MWLVLKGSMCWKFGAQHGNLRADETFKKWGLEGGLRSLGASLRSESWFAGVKLSRVSYNLESDP
jgi:hypothetical protein